MTRRIFRASPASATPAGFSIGVTLTPASPAAAIPTQIAPSDVRGPFHQLTSSSVVEGVAEDVFFIYMSGVTDGADIFQWAAPVYESGEAYEIPGVTVEIGTPTAYGTSITVTYDFQTSINIGCFVNGQLFMSNVECGLYV